METVVTKTEGNKITVQLNGNVDTSNAENVKTAIAEAFGDRNFDELVFDAENLKYISSAGLRVVLFFRKKVPECTMMNVSADVYDVLEMTGFTEMMTVKKAYRNVSVDGCEVIGEGANGIFYRLNEDTGIKVYKNPDCLADIERELKLARFAQIAFIPTALSYDVVKVGDRYGSVFELLNAKSFLQVVQQDPSRLDECIDRSVDIMKTMHSAEAKTDYLPNMKTVFQGYVEGVKCFLNDAEAEKLEKLYATIPDATTYIHGDYHFKNIMLQGNDALLIDMDTLCYGDRIFEFAGVYSANAGYGEFDKSETEDFLGIPYETACYIFNSTLRKYFGTDNAEKLERMKAKIQTLSYVRVLDHFRRHHASEDCIRFYTARLKSVIAADDDLVLKVDN